MSSDDIRRSVRSSRHDRSAGDAPSLGRMARMPGTGLPKGSRRSRRKSRSSRSSRRRRLRRYRKWVIKTWSVTLSAMVLVILGLTVWLWLVPKMKTRTAPAKPPAEIRVAAKFPPPSEAEALAAVKQGLAIRNPEMIAEYFRPGSANPRAIVDFLQGLEAEDGAIYRYEWIGSIATLGPPLEGVVVHSKAGDKLRNRLALLTPDDEGRWKIDFDAYARIVKPSWNEILEPRAEVAQVRVYAAKDNYYNGVFSDDQQWICYGLASPDMEQILLAYCKVGSKQAAAMDLIFAAENEMTRVTLEIRRVPGGASRQFEIAKVIAMDWVVGPESFDEGAR